MSNFFDKLKSFTSKLFNSNPSNIKKRPSLLQIPNSSKIRHFDNFNDFKQFSYSAPYQYKSFYIKKRNGKGKRLIAQPTADLKEIQLNLIKQIEFKLPIHGSAYAYIKNKSIKNHALLHSSSNYILKLDFKNFFNSIRPTLLKAQLEKLDVKFSDSDYEIMSFLFFWREKQNSPLKLSVGAPSSPTLSNFIMYSFDQKLQALCKQHACVYSRYADDITISSKFKFYDVNFPQLVEALLKEEFQGKIKLNPIKTKYLSCAHRRYVTGITIANNGKLTIGSKQKRLLSCKIHHFKIKKLTNEDEILTLKGQLSFAIFIYPELKNQFARKYGEHTLNRLLKYQASSSLHS